jgi:hypothetical protein
MPFHFEIRGLVDPKILAERGTSLDHRPDAWNPVLGGNLPVNATKPAKRRE